MTGYEYSILGAVALIVFWVVIVAAGLWLMSRLFPQSSRPAFPGASPSSSALEILKQRYARGEITSAEYEEMRQILEQ